MSQDCRAWTGAADVGVWIGDGSDKGPVGSRSNPENLRGVLANGT